MAVEGIGNLAQTLDYQLRQPALNLPVGLITPITGNAVNAPVAQDTFTPSTQSESAQATPQDAGIFQIGQGGLIAATSGILFLSTNPNATPGGAPARAVSAAGANSSTPANPGQLFKPTPAGKALPAKALPSTNVQEQVQSLNAELPALGLSKVEIQEIDNFAIQIQNFNPAAYTNLINQFEALAQQATQQGAANAAAKATGGGSRV